MNYQDNIVGNVNLPEQSPNWLVNLAAAISTVDRSEFLREIDSLTSQVREANRRAAIIHARSLVAEFGLLKIDVFPIKQPLRQKITAKYRDPTTGNSWSGRGPIPSWLRGKNLAEYEVS